MPRAPSDHAPVHSRAAHVIYLILTTVSGLIGAATVWFGAQITWLGGTWYYLLLGLALSVAAALAWLGRHRAALGLFTAAFVATILWSLVEIAGKGWMPAWGFDFAARSGIIALLFALTVIAFAFRSTPPRSTPRRAVLGLFGGGVVAALALVGVFWERTTEPAGAALAGAPPASPAASGADWTAFGGTTRGQRYSALDRITTTNVADLQEAWRFNTGDSTPREGRIFYSAQNTPLKVGDLLYTCSPSSQVFALDPATGAEVWSFDPQNSPDAMESTFSVACRAVGHAEIGPAGAQCAARIYVTTEDGRLIARDALDGSDCAAFGTDGTVDLTEGMGERQPGFFSNNSGPTVAGGVVIVGQQVSDNQRRDSPSGVVRAYDAASGELRWAWDVLRPDPQAPLAEGEIYPRGTPNVWNVISADEELGLAFLGTGNPGADQWGGDRTPEEEEVTAAVVAVDLETGEERWSYATVRLDRWDYDIGAQPMLVDVEIDGAPRRAVMQGTKTGRLFLLDALTGEPLRPVEEVPVPQGGRPSDDLSPVQPFPAHYPLFAGMPGSEPETLEPRDTWGITPIDAAMCRLTFHQARYEGMFTPLAEPGTPMLMMPGIMGGMNWGGMGFDPAQRLLISNYSRMPNIVTLIARENVEDVPVGDGGARPDQEVAPQAGTPYGVDRPTWLSVLNIPCIAPPWGIMAATHIDTGELVWSQPFGTGFDSGPLGIPSRLKIVMGTANQGGPLVTAGGLTFIGAAQDDYLRAFETATGRLLWQARLDAGPQAGPMTYEHEGRQYVAIVNAGHARLETNMGDALTVFALPE
ncbi:pyrroloquinoline quinone-dependent dehydrogenase [Paracoccus sp. Z118]|uniref:outer membrane protein assembly factor BamB family protein n=1 Tax=Paracoccus sp. Z118 TaxID=2851017 RepID=UPI001C2C6216|nr:PQQ-binding-like beta-propeller repeat protein [Paracoccus sp. Z118]MBV0892841.1 pyrroloquinoline quinone-dependent dehydrogenase [Paracoccus sp. Z118]